MISEMLLDCERHLVYWVYERQATGKVVARVFGRRELRV